jgi:hypothetical protein
MHLCPATPMHFLSAVDTAAIIGQSIPKGLTFRRATMRSFQAVPNAPKIGI